jgi:uncharacterized membrane protein
MTTLYKIVVIVCWCLLINSIAVHAQELQEKYTLTLELRDAVENKGVENVLIEMVMRNSETNAERTISSFIDKSAFDLELEEGAYELRFYVDNLSTKGKDYVGIHVFDLKEDKKETVSLLPVGSVQGAVLDNLNNLVRQAVLKISCEKEYADRVPETTDNFGSFESLYLPVGVCQVTANFGSSVGYQKVTITQGSLSEVTIALNQSTIGKNISGWIFLGIVILALFGAAVFSVHKFNRIKKQNKQNELQQQRAQKEKETRKQEEKPYEQKRTKRQQDLLNTLNEREKKVVQFLLESDGKSTQAKIRYETGIPKTSLVRVFTALEYKKIITVEKIGKLKKIKLTDWFVEKE